MKSSHRIRIIGGEYRSRLINVSNQKELRPTSSRSRETLFNWLQNSINNAHCLDLFSGTGALGIEAISRGAKHVTFIEKEAATYQTLKNNIESLHIPKNRYTLIQGDSLNWLTNQDQYLTDILFLDPPFFGDLYQTTLELISRHLWLDKIKALTIEVPINLEILHPILSTDFTLHREMTTKQSHLYYYQHNTLL